MSNKDFERALSEQLSELKKEQLPERDLWQGIEIALANEPAPNDIKDAPPVKTSQQPKLVAVAAAVAFVGVFSWFGMNQPESGMSKEDLVAVLSSQHEQQKNELLVKFEGQPALTANWQQQLTELDEAADAIKAALEQDPNNVALLKMLQNVHQQQIDLIERVHAPKWRQI